MYNECMIYLREQFEKIEFIDFENVKEEQGYGAPVTYEGLTYQNNEAVFQAQKCFATKDREAFTNMNPSEAKKVGRKVLLCKDWEMIKMSVMAGIVKAKFEQNEELAKKLLATGDAYLEEGNDWDFQTTGRIL